MGAGTVRDITGCIDGPATTACSTSRRRGDLPATTLASGATYISNVGGAANYRPLTSRRVLAASPRWAIRVRVRASVRVGVARAGRRRQPAPAENQGFLRRDALLAIIMVTNEDDCSARAGINLYDTCANTMLLSQLGPPSNYRCNEFGHLCDGQRPPREKAPGGDVNTTVMLNNCTSSECDGSLIPVAEFAARIKALKAGSEQRDCRRRHLGARRRRTTSRGRTRASRTPRADWQAVPGREIAHSCTSADGSFADPAVRIANWVSAFGANGITSSICDVSFAPHAAADREPDRHAAVGGRGDRRAGGPDPELRCHRHRRAGRDGRRRGRHRDGRDRRHDRRGQQSGDRRGDGRGRLGGGCGCQTGGAAPSVLGVIVAGAISALLARRRRRDRASGTLSRG